MRSLDFVDSVNQRRDLPPFRVGDTVRVHVKVREGEKERIQIFEGVVIRRRGGSSAQTFTVRKVSNGVGVERIFPVQSPSVAKVDIKARGHVRRSRLYYLRGLRGKKARLHSKVRDLSGLLSDEEIDARDGVAPVPPEEPAEETVAEASADEVTAEAPEREAAAAPEGESQSETESDSAAESAPESESAAASDSEVESEVKA